MNEGECLRCWGREFQREGGSDGPVPPGLVLGQGKRAEELGVGGSEVASGIVPVQEVREVSGGEECGGFCL